RVRVVHREAGAHQAIHVIDLGAAEVGDAEVVNDDLHTLVVDHDVVLAPLIVESHAVLHSRATAAADKDAEGQLRVVFLGELLLEGPDHILFADNRLRHLVVEGQDDAAGHDVEDVGEDVQQLAHVLQGGQLRRHQHQHALGVVEDADHDVGEGDAEVEDDVPERVDQDAHCPVDQVDGDQIGLLRAQHPGQKHHAAGVMEDRPQHRLSEVLGRNLARRGQTTGRGEVGDQGGVVVGKGQVDEQDLAREPLGQGGGQVDRDGRA